MSGCLSLHPSVGDNTARLMGYVFVTTVDCCSNGSQGTNHYLLLTDFYYCQYWNKKRPFKGSDKSMCCWWISINGRSVMAGFNCSLNASLDHDSRLVSVSGMFPEQNTFREVQVAEISDLGPKSPLMY